MKRILLLGGFLLAGCSDSTVSDQDTNISDHQQEHTETESDNKPVNTSANQSSDEQKQAPKDNQTDSSPEDQNSETERKEKVLIDAPHINQTPELQRGCEVTSLAMMLGHAGVSVDKMELAAKIDRVPFQKKGVKGNPNNGFVGSMRSMDQDGFGVYHEPIVELAESYLPGKIIDLTGKKFDAVLDKLDQGKPVVVIVTSTFDKVPEDKWKTWETSSGEIEITYNMHAVLVTGYDKENLYVNDPLDSKNRKLDKAEFITGWKQFGQQAISYES
ncbi:C39 family peptidase [Mesobacillus harenae]|uniref:C39 family peptidase n=1 Tax=Mesobacillus harenae TaxID=2213203 RepID=UPI00158027BB|nr:C39 family peptidase [Mesobacillus harenae]